MPSDERRIEPRIQTGFYAAEVRGSEVYYRLVRNISRSGFSFDDRFPLERPGDLLRMEFPLPGSTEPIAVTAEVVYARPDRGVGLRIKEIDRDRFDRFLAVLPPATSDRN